MEVAKENEIWHNGSLGDEDDARTSNARVVQRKRAIPHSKMKNDMTCILVTALCNQPEAAASDLGDDQSRYLYLTGQVIHLWATEWVGS